MQSSADPVFRHLETAHAFLYPTRAPFCRSDDLPYGWTLDGRHAPAGASRFHHLPQPAGAGERHGNKLRVATPAAQTTPFSVGINVHDQQHACYAPAKTAKETNHRGGQVGRMIQQDDARRAPGEHAQFNPSRPLSDTCESRLWIRLDKRRDDVGYAGSLG
jgi:hypothetical protein